MADDDPHMMLTYLDNALRDGEITDEEWMDKRAEWLVYLDGLENARSDHWSSQPAQHGSDRRKR